MLNDSWYSLCLYSKGYNSLYTFNNGKQNNRAVDPFILYFTKYNILVRYSIN